MKKFRFRLAKVLEYRLLIRDDRKKDLLQANAAVREVEERIEYLNAEMLAQLRTQQSTVHELELQAMYGRRLRTERDEAEKKLQVCRKRAEEALIAYRAAAKDVEVLEKLKEKKKEAYNEHVRKEEEKFLDELSVMKGMNTE